MRIEVKQIYSISNNDTDQALRHYIQRFFTEYCKETGYKPEEFQQKGNALYYNRLAKEAFLTDPKVIKHFERIKTKSTSYSKNIQVAYGEKAEFDKARQALKSKWEKAGLTDEEGNQLEFDKQTRKEFLTVDELLFLGLKGMIKKSSLSEIDKEILNWFHEQEMIEETENKHIEQLFYLKKLEIMISAIFNEKYKLNEKKLRADIMNVVRGGDYSVLFTQNGYIEDQAPEQVVRRSYLDLQSYKKYYEKKK